MPAVRKQLEMLVTEAAAPLGYAVHAIAFGRTVEITLAKGGDSFVVWLRRWDPETPHYCRTGALGIGHRGDPPDRLGYQVLDALRAALQAWETTLPERAETHLFDPVSASRSGPASSLEWLAVAAGLKPASRTVVPPHDVAPLVAQARARGLRACVTDGAAFVAGFCSDAVDLRRSTLLYVGRSASAAAAAADAERAMIEWCGHGARATEDQVRALGSALGYPPCCIEAFLIVRESSPAAIRFAALQRTPGGASWLLNDFFDERAIVSHAACRYDCAPSIAYARALIAVLAADDPHAAAVRRETLSGLVAAFRQGGALRLVLRGDAAGGPRAIEHLEAAGSGSVCDRWSAALHDTEAVAIEPDAIHLLRGGAEWTSLAADPGEVLIRAFA